MSIQIFPNWCKKIGLVIFLTPFLFSFFCGLVQPFNDSESKPLILDFLGRNSAQIIELVGLLGLLIYMLSKEKIEDDYIRLLRFESLQMAVVLSILISIISFFLDFSKTIDINFSISTLIAIYLVIFYMKKRAYS